MKLGVIGGGYVGLVTASCLADLGFQVILIESDHNKRKRIADGVCPFFEPGLNDLLLSGLKKGCITVKGSIRELAEIHPDAAFLTVGTPNNPATRRCDTADLDLAVDDIVKSFQSPVFLILKSTVPIGTASRIKAIIKEHHLTQRMFVINNPEFLREGSAIQDFLRPDRVVIGTNHTESIHFMKRIYEPLLRNGHPMFVMSHESAELSKYAANLMLASRISTVNQIAQLSEKCGADIKDIEQVLRTDHRIGAHYLYAGLGYGGSCFPKDVQEFIHACREHNVDPQIAESVHRMNESQQLMFLPHIQKSLPKGSTIAVLGLSFKPLTDDVRGAASLALIPRMIENGFSVKCHDPKASQAFLNALPKHLQSHVFISETASAALVGADALVLLTEWHEYRILDPNTLSELMRGRFIFDGRNIFDPARWREANFHYFGVGRGYIHS